jgi:hypothetical protein
LHRSVGELLDEAHGAVGLAPGDIQQDPASLVRFPQPAQLLDLG